MSESSADKIESLDDKSIKHIRVVLNPDISQSLQSMEEFEREIDISQIKSQSESIPEPSSSQSSPKLFSGSGSPLLSQPSESEEPSEIKIDSQMDDIQEKYEQMRKQYDFRHIQAKSANLHPPEISGDDLKGVCGIANMGNTCYANSCLHILRAAGDFTRYLLETELVGDKTPLPDKNSKESKVLIGYQDMVRTLWSASLPAFIRPMGWIGVVREAVHNSVYEMFAHPIPNDSHEYLVWLLDNFHEAMLLKNKNVVPSGMDPWQQFLVKNNTYIADTFFGLIYKEIRCHGCNNCSISYEPFNVLKIPCLDPELPFTKWLENYFEPEELDDYACDNCKPTRTKATILQSIWRAPRNLFISVRRFSHDRQKNHMAVPSNGTAEIDIKNTYTPVILKKGAVKTKYHLRGVIDHHGSHMGGHYTAQFLHPVSKHWWWMDDESAQFMPEPRFGRSNYIFLYRSVF